MTNYELIRTADELRNAIETIEKQLVVGLDTETTDLDPYTSRLRLVQLATPDRVYIVDFDRFSDGDTRGSDALAPLRRLLAAPRPIKIAHNAKFDATRWIV
jgi:ribonuclease D